MRISVALVVAVAVAAVAASLAGASPARSSCTPTMTKIGKFPARVFCGSAKAVVSVGGKTLRFSNGQCAISQGFWTVNIGTIELGAPDAQTTKSYFGITLAKPSHADGSYTGVPIGFNVPGKGWAVSGATLKLKNGGKAATFSGHLFLSSTKASGTVAC